MSPTPYLPSAVPSPDTAEALRAVSRARRAAAYPDTDPRLAPLRADLVRRLRAAGVRLPAAAFDALVSDMARVALQWSITDTERRVPPTRAPDRPRP